jgi:hypothetical protein
MLKCSADGGMKGWREGGGGGGTFCWSPAREKAARDLGIFSSCLLMVEGG